MKGGGARLVQRLSEEREPGVLLCVQSLVTFVAIPLGASIVASPWMLDLGTLALQPSVP